MINVGIFVYVDEEVDISNELLSNFQARVIADGGTFESASCLYDNLQTLGGSLGIRSVAKRLDLFSDEKISVNSSIQNVNDISKLTTDFSQTFTIPASKNNNKIFKHWYENSLDNGFSTLIKSDAYIELDTIPFRTGKIQLESCSIKDGKPQDYRINFIGALGTLKDKFAGLFLKDLDSTFYDFAYSGTVVKNKVTDTSASANVMFPLISSNKYWNYGIGGVNDISLNTSPIVFSELFPAIKLSSIFDMIDRDSKWNINFNGSFLSDPKFTSAYLYLKNADLFKTRFFKRIDFRTKGNLESLSGVTVDLTNDFFVSTNIYNCQITITPDAGFTTIPYTVYRYVNGIETVELAGVGTSVFPVILDGNSDQNSFYIESQQSIEFVFKIEMGLGSFTNSATMSTQVLLANIAIRLFFPEIKIEDFFSGILKQFNLTCYSTDGINYTIEQIENYYNTGTISDITQYIKSDSVNLNRVKTFKKINFEYEKSESIINVGFKNLNGVEYGSLLYDTGNDGEEYNVKLPFENLNFNNLKDKLQVGYALKTDLQKYVPKPIILYDYNPSALTTLTGTTFYFNDGSTTTAETDYKAFGQEYFNGTNTFSLNFNEQQSTLTNQLVNNSLYNQYYQNYLLNIFDSKARLIKVSGILPTSLLTSLKLNNKLIIRDKRYLINNIVTDLTTGEVEFELITDFRPL